MEAVGKGGAPVTPALLPPLLANAPAKHVGTPGRGAGLGSAHGAAGFLAITRSCCAMSSNACATLLISSTEASSAIWVRPVSIGGAAGKMQDLGSQLGAAAAVCCSHVPLLQRAEPSGDAAWPEGSAPPADADAAGAGCSDLLDQSPSLAGRRVYEGLDGVDVKAAACR